MPPAPKPAARRKPAPRPKPKARRRAIRWPLIKFPRWSLTAWLYGLLILNVSVGLAVSPITGAQKVRVVGASADDYERLTRHMQIAQGIPALRFSALQLESLVLAREDLARVSFRQNLFGRGLLTIRPRVPVARLEGERPVWLSDQGVIYAGPARPGTDGLPRFRISSEAREANLAMVGAWDSARIANLCVLARKELGGTAWTVERDARGVISLDNGSGARVVLGTSEAFSDKVGTLRRILEMQPDILSQVRELNLTAPNNPAAVPLAPKS